MRHEYVTLEHLLLGLLDDRAHAARCSRRAAPTCASCASSSRSSSTRGRAAARGRRGAEPQQTLGVERVLQRAAIHAMQQRAGGDRRHRRAGRRCSARSQSRTRSTCSRRRASPQFDLCNYISHGIVPRHDTRSSGAQREREGARAATTRTSERRAAEEPARGLHHRPRSPRPRQGSIDPLIGRDARARAHDPGAVPPAQEQPALRRRPRRRQDRHRRGPGAAHPRGQGARGAQGRAGLLARHGRAARRHQVPRRVRGAAQGRDQGARRSTRTRSCSSTRSTPSSAPARPAAARWTRRTSSSRRWPRASCAASARPPTRSTRAPSSATARWPAASRRSTSASRRVEDTIEILKGLKSRYEEHHEVKYDDDALEAAAELAAKHINERLLPDKAIDVHRRGRRARAAAPEDERTGTVDDDDVETVVAKMARIPAKRVSASDKRPAAATSRPSCKQVIFGQDEAIETLVSAIKLSRAGPARAGQADRLVPVLRPDRRRQDRAGQAAREGARRRVPALRHERVHGEAHRLAADRRAARLRRLRPGRPAHRRHPQAPARGAGARRDREGAPGPLQHPAPGDGPRHADRQQRPQGRLPQRHPDHDHQRRRAGDGAQGGRLRRHAATAAPTRRRPRAPSSARSRPSSATASTAGCCSAACRAR